MLTPTSMPTAQTELVGQALPIIAASTTSPISQPKNSSPQRPDRRSLRRQPALRNRRQQSLRLRRSNPICQLR
jgi:hypothetical protein